MRLQQRPHTVDIEVRDMRDETGIFFALCHALDIRLPELEKSVVERAPGCTRLRLLLDEAAITKIKDAISGARIKPVSP